MNTSETALPSSISLTRPDDWHVHLRDGLQLREDAAQIVRAVFGVDQQPVETGAGADFGAEGFAEAEP